MLIDQVKEIKSNPGTKKRKKTKKRNKKYTKKKGRNEILFPENMIFIKDSKTSTRTELSVTNSVKGEDTELPLTISYRLVYHNE